MKNRYATVFSFPLCYNGRDIQLSFATSMYFNLLLTTGTVVTVVVTPVVVATVDVVTVVVAPVVVAAVDVVTVVLATVDMAPVVVVTADVVAVVGVATVDVSAVVELLARAKATPNGIKKAAAARTAVTIPKIIQNLLHLFFFICLGSSHGTALFIVSVSVQFCF